MKEEMEEIKKIISDKLKEVKDQSTELNQSTRHKKISDLRLERDRYEIVLILYEGVQSHLYKCDFYNNYLYARHITLITYNINK